VCVLLGFSLNATELLAQKAQLENLSAGTLTKILDRYRGQAYENFSRFALDTYTTSKPLFTREQHNAIGRFAANKRLKPEQAFVVHRLLGVYTRLKYGGEARRMLAKLVSIPSVSQTSVEQHENANFIRLQKAIASYAKQFKLKYKNIDGRVYEISLPSKGGVEVGFYAHGDVAPVNLDLWVLEDGTKLDPFKLTQVDNKLYARGIVENKNAIVASMIAMRIIKEEEIRLFNSIKLLVDTTRVSRSTAMRYYFQQRPKPDYNIAFDGGYPVILAESELIDKHAMYRQPNSRWLSALLDIASENLGLARDPAWSTADNSVHALANGVQFGLAMPSDKNAGEKANEFKTIDQFLLDLQIVTETMIRIGLMRNLE
jgi:acetylornithine deacetylase/succinyl-diaminopimelate desuccinylase-like protein